MTDSEQIAIETTNQDGEGSNKTTKNLQESVVNVSKPDPDINDAEDIQRMPNGDDMDTDGDSEAETLIQSPEKQRQPNADTAATVHHVKATTSDAGSLMMTSTSDKENATRKRKRPRDERNGPPSKSSSRRSSPLSSPVAQVYSEAESETSGISLPRQLSKRNHSETEGKISSPKKRRRRPSEIVPPSPSHKRSKRESIESAERRETRSATYPRPSDDEKSPEPEPIPRREHRRGASTQLTSGEFGEKRKRGRPPLINTRRPRSIDHGSDDSDVSESRAKSARPVLSKLASHDHDIMSPAKPGPRKWKDKVGRTPLARACNDGDLDAVRARYLERPEDLREQDNAKNTPLQIASIEGWDEVVEFLLQKGAEVNVRNIDGDTPLIDAVENGHIPVIKLLLAYGANARAANMKGYEPAELVKKEDETFDEIRALLNEARQKTSKKTPGVEATDHNRDGASSRAASAASPRDSPPIGGKSPPAFGNRRRTGRSESTRNDLLYQANTQENLVKLAGKGDVQGVANILSILEKADTESLIAAAKAGHEEVLQLLIAMGRPHPDPEPVRGPKLSSGHNTPMMAAIGRGHPDVVKLLANQSGFNPTKTYRDKTYYEIAEERKGDKWQEEVTILRQAYDKYKGKKSQSPRKTRDNEKLKVKPVRRSSSANSAQRRQSSPDSTRKLQLTKTKDGPGADKRKVSDSLLEKQRSTSQEDRSNSVAATSDQDQKPPNPAKTHRTRRSVSDLPPMSPVSEPAQRRRRLVSGKEHRNRHNPSDSSDDEMTDVPDAKNEDRAHSELKRNRRNSTPQPSNEKSDRAPSKKRRTVLESSPDDSRNRLAETQGIDKITPDPDSSAKEDHDKQSQSVTSAKKTQEPEVVVIKRESPAPNIPLDEPLQADAMTEATLVPAIKEKSARAESEDDYSPPPADESNIGESEADKLDREKAEEAARKAEEAAKAAAIEEEARREQEEAERKRRIEEEREIARKAEEQARKEEEEAERQKQEKERIRQQQLAEEEQRRQQEAARLEEEQRKLQAERQRIAALPVLLARTAQMIDDGDSEVRDAKFLRRRYLPLYVVRSRDFGNSERQETADEQWIPNFQAAGLLATKDLKLVGYGNMAKKPATEWEVKCMWRWARSQLAYELTHDCWNSAPSEDLELERIAERKFTTMETPFWVKHSDFVREALQTPHLQNLELSIRRSSLLDYTKIFAKKHHSPAVGSKISMTNGVSPAVHTDGIV